jgi:hypothetical protein
MIKKLAKIALYRLERRARELTRKEIERRLDRGEFKTVRGVFNSRSFEHPVP